MPSRRYLTLPAAGNENNGTTPTSTPASSDDNDILFLLKLAAVSFAGGAAIKYGSLAADLPFHPTAAGALTIVLTPPSIYLIWLLTQKKE